MTVWKKLRVMKLGRFPEAANFDIAACSCRIDCVIARNMLMHHKLLPAVP